MEQIKTASLPTGILGGLPRLRIQSGAAYGEVVFPKSDGTVALWSVSHLTSGVNAQLRLYGQIPVNR